MKNKISTYLQTNIVHKSYKRKTIIVILPHSQKE